MPDKIRTFNLYPSDRIILPGIETWVTPFTGFGMKALGEYYCGSKEFVALLIESDENDDPLPSPIGCLCEVEKVSGEGKDMSFLIKGKEPFLLCENNGIIEDQEQVFVKGQIIGEPVIEYGSDEVTDLVSRFRDIDYDLCNMIDNYAEGNGNKFFAAAMEHFLPNNPMADNIKFEYLKTEDIPSKISVLEYAVNFIEDTIEYTKGAELYKYEHYQAAIEQFKKSMQEGNPYFAEAADYSIYAYKFLNKYEEAVKLFNSLADILPKAPDLMFAISCCYYALGNKEGTAVFLQEYLGHSPHTDTRIPLICGNSHYKLPPSYKEFISDGMEAGLSPYVLTELILPLLTDCRKVTAAFFDEVMLDGGSDEQTDIDKLSALLASKYGLRTELGHTITDHDKELVCIPKIYFYKNEELSEEFEDLRKGFRRVMIQNGPDEAFKYYFMEEGRILGYPECCIGRSAELRYGTYDGMTFEKDLSMSILLEKSPFKKSDLTSLYSMEFYPCSPHCSEAIATGEVILNVMYDYDPVVHDIYLDILLPMHEAQVLRWNNTNSYRLREYADSEICRLLELGWEGYDHLRGILDNTPEFKEPFK